ncbi:MAG TPA: cache domain-containing protein [Ardenticatenaceae bacterium]|nr:cache domain-containing protein [Ardenticatenaceae bacterium]
MRDLSSLRLQAIIWTVLPLAVITLLVTAIGAYAYGNVVRSLVEQRDVQLAQISADRVSENMVNYASILTAIANTREIQSGIPTRQRGALATAASQPDLLDKFDAGIFLLDAEGVLVTSEPYRPEFVGQSFALRDYFTFHPQSREPYFFSDIFPGVTGDEDIIVVSVPIWQGETFRGVIAGEFEVAQQQLGEEIRKLRIGEAGFAYLVDRNGRVIYHPDPQFIGADFSGRQAVQNLQQREAGALLTTGEEGEAIMVGYAPVTATGWGLIIREPWDELINPIRPFQFVAAGALLVGVALALVIVSIGTRHITEPIKALVQQTAQLAEGHTAEPIAAPGTIREIRLLADAFNEMADRVARYRAGLQRYVASVTHSQEEERKRIARELHDDTVQSLIALGRRLELLEKSLENPIEAAKHLGQLQLMLNDTIAEVRQFSRDLRPLLLEDLGLEAALRQMLSELERREGIITALEIEGETGRLDPDMEVTLYRITQEALNNIRKHAQATLADVHLRVDDGQVRLSVRDNGRGFSIVDTADLARRGSYGLMGIRERAQLFGGELTVQSAEDAGTLVEVALPLDGAPHWGMFEPAATSAGAGLATLQVSTVNR